MKRNRKISISEINKNHIKVIIKIKDSNYQLITHTDLKTTLEGYF